MTKQEFKEMINQGIVLLDGATGSNLQKRGMPAGVCPELWITEHPQVLQQLQDEYIKAGSNIVYAPTFSGNRIKMEEYGLGDRLEEINTALVRICRENAAGRALVAGDITMTGAQLEPLGDLKLEELIDVYKEQLAVLAAAGVDLIVVETMMSLQETRAAVIAAKEVCPDLPVMATLSFTEKGTTLYGASAESAVVVLQAMGVDAVGLNCSAGPDKMLEVLKRMASVSEIPLIAKPNAGLPKLGGDGVTVYDMDADVFAEHMKAMIAAGADILGGCCGTDPEYIRKLKEAAADCPKKNKDPKEKEADRIWLSSEREVYPFEKGQELDLGQGLDFTADEDMAQEAAEGIFDTAVDNAFELMDDEKDAIRFYAGGRGGQEEGQLLLNAITEVTQMVHLPVVIAVACGETAETVLRAYPGIGAVECLAENEQEKEAVFNAVKRYGAKLVTIDKKIICC